MISNSMLPAICLPTNTQACVSTTSTDKLSKLGNRVQRWCACVAGVPLTVRFKQPVTSLQRDWLLSTCLPLRSIRFSILDETALLVLHWVSV